MIKEIQRKCASGYLALVILPVLFILDGWFFYEAIQAQSLFMVVGAVLIFIVLLVCCLGFFMVHPNQARVLTLFGTYVGSALETGLRWANPVLCQEGGFIAGAEFRLRSTESQ